MSERWVCAIHACGRPEGEPHASGCPYADPTPPPGGERRERGVMGDDFSRAFVAAYDRMPLWWRDQFDASVRDAIPVIERICAWMTEHAEELAALDQTDERQA